MFIDGQEPNPVFRDINSRPLGYPCAALDTIGSGWTFTLPVAVDDQSRDETRTVRDLGKLSVGRGCSAWFWGLNNFHTSMRISNFDFEWP